MDRHVSERVEATTHTTAGACTSSWRELAVTRGWGEGGTKRIVERSAIPSSSPFIVALRGG